MYAVRSHVGRTLFPCARRCLVAPRALSTKTAKSTKSTKSTKATKSTQSTTSTKSTKSTKSKKSTDAPAEPEVSDAKSELARISEAKYEVARKLKEEGVWGYLRGSRRKGNNTDRYRVNVVSEKLCDDIVDYIKPTLARHEGCDLIDIFPGAGIWSRTLNDALKPRTHLLLEPDTEFYEPYLKPLLERPGTKLLPESGIIWEHLNKILDPLYLPHQVERKYGLDETPERNDTLLVTMNLAMHPKRKFRSFESLAQLVLFQIVSSIRPGSLFQKYGLVRMLIWVPDLEKEAILPRTCQRRKKMAVEAEVSTEYVCEIAGGEQSDFMGARPTHWYRRAAEIDMESTRMTLERMRQQGFVLPLGREPHHVLHYMGSNMESIPGTGSNEGSSEHNSSVDRPAYEELERLEKEFSQGLFDKESPEFKRIRTLKYWVAWSAKRHVKTDDLLREYDRIVQAYVQAGSDENLLEEAAKLTDAWNAKVNILEKSLRAEVLLHRDNVHLLYQDPPVLSWDRRYVEPLRAQPNEFFPAVPCALLDIQPKAAARVLRDMGPKSNRGGDTFDLMLRHLLQRSSDPVLKALNTIYAGAGDGVFPECPSLVDPSLGGSPVGGAGQLASRALNERQLIEIIEAWVKWPFRPSYSELVSRTIEDFSDSDSEEVAGNHNPAEGNI